MNFTYADHKDTISLRRLAHTLNLPYPMLLKASKKPIEGVPYDPTEPNCAEVDNYIAKRVDPEVLEGIDWVEVARAAQEAIREPLPKTFETCQKVTLRKDDTIYEIVLMTETHVVLLADTTPRVMSNSTFLHQGPRMA